MQPHQHMGNVLSTTGPGFMAIDNPALADELGDLLYSLCELATAVNVDLDHALTTALAKYEARWQEKGHPGSGN